METKELHDALLNICELVDTDDNDNRYLAKELLLSLYIDDDLPLGKMTIPDCLEKPIEDNLVACRDMDIEVNMVERAQYSGLEFTYYNGLTHLTTFVDVPLANRISLEEGTLAVLYVEYDDYGTTWRKTLYGSKDFLKLKWKKLEIDEIIATNNRQEMLAEGIMYDTASGSHYPPEWAGLEIIKII